MIDRAQRFASYLQETLGHELRAVTVYGPDMGHQVFLREDLQDQYESDTVNWLLRKGRNVGEPLYEVGERATAMGDIQASVHVFQNALLVQYVLGPKTGIIVSIQPTVGRALVDFINESRQQLGNT